MTQSSFNQFDEDGETETTKLRLTEYHLKHLPDEADPTDILSCPWCCMPPEQFEHHDDGKVTCRNCNTVVPVKSDWYLKGKKIPQV